MNRQILEEASAWFIECRAGTMSPTTRMALLHWLTRSPDHIRAYLEISGAYTQLPKSGALPDKVLAGLLNQARGRLDNTVMPLSELTDAVVLQASNPTPSARAPVQPRWRNRLAIACGLVLAFVGSAYWLVQQHGVYTTATAEQRTVTLEDGSRIELNACSRVRVRYSKTARMVELLEGQALFQVTKDKQRPFVVQSGATEVRAVGTQFDVYRRKESTTVTVVEGIVTVIPNITTNLDSSGSALSAGDQAVVTAEGDTHPHHANITAAMAWTRGELEFEETPLPEAAEEFNRYNPRRMVIDSAGLEKVRISGVYSSADPASLIIFLRSQPDLIVSESGRVIHVRAR
jgi:transmembrane sensor